MKYCPMCGVENIGTACFCKSCGKKIGENIINNNQPVQAPPNQNMSLQAYGQPYPYSLQPPHRNMKPFIAIAGVGIALIVVFALLLTSGVFTSGLLGGNDGSGGVSGAGGCGGGTGTTKIAVAGGPTASIQSIATGGNALTTPAVSHTAEYGYYLSGEKIGSISFTNTGEEYYGGELCNKIIGDGSFNFDIYNQDIGMSFDIEGYESTYDSSLMYCDYDFAISYDAFSFSMQGTVDVDKYSNEITSTLESSMPEIDTVTTVITVSDDFWTKTSFQDNLYIGYVNEVYYTATAWGYDTSVLLSISVTGQEDVAVGKGTFTDCYVVKIEQDAGVTTTTSYMWIDENGVCPKMLISNSAAAMGYRDLIIELEEYYTT